MNNTRFENWPERLLFMVSPLFAYLVFELITGNVLRIQGLFLVLNLLFFCTIYFVLAVLIRRVRLVYLALNLVFTVLALAEYFVVMFRARPIMLWDLMAWQTAATVAGGYRYVITPRVAVAVVLMAVWSFLIWKFPLKLPGGRRWAVLSAGALLWTFSLYSCFFKVVVPAKGIDVSLWNPVETYETQGYLLCTVRMIDYLSVDPPAGYQHSTVHQLYNELEETEAGTGAVPVHIICIMNESWSDLRVIAPFETNLPFLSYYDSMAENCVKGSSYVPVFGSMTSNTEYEFLTGNSMAFAPAGSVPFQIYTENHTMSLIDSVKAQGYRTIGMHPYPGANWNRAGAYASMGFDEFLDEEYYTDSPRIRGYVSDKGAYDKIIEMTEANSDNEPLFFFLVTMQNHGGYAQEYDADVHLTELEGYPETEQYLSLIRETDQALENLIAYYEQNDQPTLIMMFGDHQPSIEEEFYETLYGGSLSELSPQHYLERYATPYFIWTNYDNCLTAEAETLTDISAVYLSGLVLKAANLPLNGYETFLEVLRSQTPVIHMLGYYDSTGNWQSWTGWRDKESYVWLRQLELFQYYRMFDKKKDN